MPGGGDIWTQIVVIVVDINTARMMALMIEICPFAGMPGDITSMPPAGRRASVE